MSDVVIRAEGIGKKYMIGHQAQNGGYTSLRDVVTQSARSILHKTRDLVQGKPVIQGDTYEEVWALKDIDFEIRQGEAVGIIGRNGAGKSTLLKILSRITEPSTGRVTIKGRVASLLEVGTGFHPELSGRENIYLNGAILGMTRREIRHKFDEIVAFAEVEKYLDTPVKRYSSGMYVRLAFAVAAHLEPEILVVDEVLAVGDADFQKKCLNKMSNMGTSEGRTILFVSHNIAAVQVLCTKAIVMNEGRIASVGDTDDQIKLYLDSISRPNLDTLKSSIRLDKSVEITSISITPNPVVCGDEVYIGIDFCSDNEIRMIHFAVLIFSELGNRVAILDLRQPNGPLVLPLGTKPSIKIAIGKIPFVEGEYSLGLYVCFNEINREILDLGRFTVVAHTRQTDLIPYARQHRGLVELEYTASIGTRTDHNGPA